MNDTTIYNKQIGNLKLNLTIYFTAQLLLMCRV